MCCSNGKVVLAELDTPMLLQHIFCDQDNLAKNFWEKIRIYNSILAFDLVGVRVDCELANEKAGVYIFHIQDSFYHWIGSLLPETDSEPHYLQMYQPHQLTLKVGVPIMLLRNLDPVNGLCNAT